MNWKQRQGFSLVFCICSIQLISITIFHVLSFDFSAAFSIGNLQKVFERKQHLNTIPNSINSRKFKAISSSCILSLSLDQESHSVPLNCIELGENSSTLDEEYPPVVVLHAICGSARTLSTWGSALARSLHLPRKIFLLDLRNHGESIPHRRSMAYPEVAADVISFLDSRNISEAVVMGHCWGGKVGAAVALLYPDRVHGLVVLETSPIDYVGHRLWNYRTRLMQNLNAIDTSQIKNSEDAEHHLGQHLPLPWFRAYVKRNLVQTAPLHWEWKVNLPAIASEMDVMGGFGVGPNGEIPEEMGYKYRGPVLFLAGDRSEFIKSSHLAQITEMFPNYLIRKLDGAGHFIMTDAPKKSLQNVKMYLDNLPKLVGSKSLSKEGETMERLAQLNNQNQNYSVSDFYASDLHGMR